MYKWIKEVFDKRFFKLLRKEVMKTLRKAMPIVIMILVLSQFFAVAIIPSESMYPTLKVKDLVLIRKTDVFERGDIIAFVEDGGKGVIKRLIGLPGDTVEVKDGVVLVNDKPLSEDYLNEKPDYIYYRQLVPEGKYFVLGDNRNNSNDSHYWGFLDEEKVRGKAEVILLPFSRLQIL